MNKVKSVFSINDLENISGIKAHTIRIWEKRYNLFNPSRASRDIRYYDLQSLQKLLSIKLLIEHGGKISKIAALGDSELHALARESGSSHTDSYYITQFKKAMYHFDADLFEKTYSEVSNEKTFPLIFKEIFIPLLHFIGLHWQTTTVSIANEHFISNLIFQKVQLNIEKIKEKPKPERNTDITFILYLPENEMHELGLLYLNYELLTKGYQTVYLGPTIRTKDLEELLDINKEVRFVAIFTIQPTKDALQKYLEEVEELVSKKMVLNIG